MNGRQKIVQQQFLNNEEAVIKRLKQVYDQSMKDINAKIAELDSSIAQLQRAYNDIGEDGIGDLAKAVLGSKANFTPEEAKATLQSMIQSKVYQKQYQEVLQKQVGDILAKMHTEQYKAVSEYLDKCYEEGFLGTMYDLQGQGIPLCFPLDQESMVRAVQLDSKIVEGYYQRMGEDVALLKKRITAEVSRGISSGMRWEQVAQQLRNKTTIGYTNAIRIARTEGHRIQCQGTMDACHKAQEMGADVVKQWDSTLDGKTRHSHAMVDGEVRELNERFSNGLMFPGDPDGMAAEVINCRCALLQRARWALKEKINPDTGEVTWEDDSFTKFDRESGKIVDFSGIADYNDFKKKYMAAAAEQSTGNDAGVIAAPMPSNDANYNRILSVLQGRAVEYRPVANHATALTDDEIINALAGGDMTRGSCASVGLAYIGQRQGWNILDFRDGLSRDTFSSSFNLLTLSRMDGIKALRADGASSITVGNRLLKQCEVGKEYYLCVGRHASIVRKLPDGTLQYLELQSRNRSGWTNFDGNPRYTLKTRFGCTSTSGASSYYDFMIDIDDSDFTKSGDFRTLLGYIDTASDAQRKGANGTIK